MLTFFDLSFNFSQVAISYRKVHAPISNCEGDSMEWGLIRMVVTESYHQGSSTNQHPGAFLRLLNYYGQFTPKCASQESAFQLVKDTLQEPTLFLDIRSHACMQPHSMLQVLYQLRNLGYDIQQTQPILWLSSLYVIRLWIHCHLTVGIRQVQCVPASQGSEEIIRSRECNSRTRLAVTLYVVDPCRLVLFHLSWTGTTRSHNTTFIKL